MHKNLKRRHRAGSSNNTNGVSHVYTTIVTIHALEFTCSYVILYVCVDCSRMFCSVCVV